MRQHHIPRSILRHFADAEGKIWMKRRGASPIRTKVENVAVKKDQYKTLHDSRPECYEKLLTALENRLKPALEEVISEELLPCEAERQKELRLFTSLQHARSPATRKFMSSVVLPHIAKESPMNMEVQVQMKLDSEYDLPMFMDLYQTAFKNLEQLPLFLIRSEDDSFVCPDDPVFLQSDSQGRITLGLFPISSRLLLQFGGSDCNSTCEPVSANLGAVLKWNQDSIYESVAVYGRSEEAVDMAAKGWLI
ncbi:DUF4238 domain-containing protein [Leptolyngbya sp. FACHB-36]|uniref:DUF4238 domain-containing protein n=1 Tax=Leptolyngbya sp. FACHB-36 TaxID=2692808 RepID=UPI001681C11B|nr:DUF4238 domain-containing protein [Leptolyngbya sp. FACHB-36]MBD2021438.1 DUF4238 domain-containing protein [Leptolyngbya sp. FACHB-36]